MVLSLLQIKEQIHAAQQAFKKAASDWLMQQPLSSQERSQWLDCIKSKDREALLSVTRQHGLPLVARDSHVHEVYGDETIQTRSPVLRRRYHVNGDNKYEQYCHMINLYEMLLRCEEVLTTVPRLIKLEDLSYFALLAGNMDEELNKAPESMDLITDYQQRLAKARADLVVADEHVGIALQMYERQHENCQVDFVDILMLLQHELQALYKHYPNTSIFKYISYNHWQTLLIDTAQALFGRSSCQHPSIDRLKIQDGLNELIDSAKQDRKALCDQLKSDVEHLNERIKSGLSSAELKLDSMMSRMALQDQLVRWRTPADPGLRISLYTVPMFNFWGAMHRQGWINPRMLTAHARVEEDVQPEEIQTQVPS